MNEFIESIIAMSVNYIINNLEPYHFVGKRKITKGSPFLFKGRLWKNTIGKPFLIENIDSFFGVVNYKGTAKPAQATFQTDYKEIYKESEDSTSTGELACVEYRIFLSAEQTAAIENSDLYYEVYIKYLDGSNTKCLYGDFEVIAPLGGMGI